MADPRNVSPRTSARRKRVVDDNIKAWSDELVFHLKTAGFDASTSFQAHDDLAPFDVTVKHGAQRVLAIQIRAEGMHDMSAANEALALVSVPTVFVSPSDLAFGAEKAVALIRRVTSWQA